MAQKAEEYGSHDKTFEMASAGSVKVVDSATGATLMQVYRLTAISFMIVHCLKVKGTQVSNTYTAGL